LAPALDGNPRPPAPPGEDDIVVILGDLGQERRDLAEAVRRERYPTADEVRRERDPDTPALRRERGRISPARRLEALRHQAAKRSFARQMLAVRYRKDGGVDCRYIEVRDTTPHWARTARYSVWVQEFSGGHRAITEEEALELLKRRMIITLSMLARLPQEGAE